MILAGIVASPNFALNLNYVANLKKIKPKIFSQFIRIGSFPALDYYYLRMKRTAVIFNSLFVLGVLNTPVFASSFSLKNLSHNLVLKSGPKEKCISESVHFLNKKNVLLLGSTLSFPFEQVPSEPAEKGECHYREEIKISEQELVSQSTRTGCPNNSENGVLVEKIKLVTEKNEQLLIYQNSFNNISFECSYVLEDVKKDEKVK